MQSDGLGLLVGRIEKELGFFLSLRWRISRCIENIVNLLGQRGDVNRETISVWRKVIFNHVLWGAEPSPSLQTYNYVIMGGKKGHRIYAVKKLPSITINFTYSHMKMQRK